MEPLEKKYSKNLEKWSSFHNFCPIIKFSEKIEKGPDTRFCHPSEAQYGHFLCIQLVLTKEFRLLGPQRGWKNLCKNTTNWPKVDDVICASSLFEPNGPLFLYAYELHEPNEYILYLIIIIGSHTWICFIFFLKQSLYSNYLLQHIFHDKDSCMSRI